MVYMLNSLFKLWIVKRHHMTSQIPSDLNACSASSTQIVINLTARNVSVFCEISTVKINEL